MKQDLILYLNKIYAGKDYWLDYIKEIYYRKYNKPIESIDDYINMIVDDCIEMQNDLIGIGVDVSKLHVDCRVVENRLRQQISTVLKDS